MIFRLVILIKRILIKKHSVIVIFHFGENNSAVLDFVFLVAKLRPQQFRMICSMIEVDDGLNTSGAIRKIVEWPRPFGLNVLVLSLDPIYNVFHHFFSCTYKPNTIHHFELIYKYQKTYFFLLFQV